MAMALQIGPKGKGWPEEKLWKFWDLEQRGRRAGGHWAEGGRKPPPVLLSAPAQICRCTEIATGAGSGRLLAQPCFLQP